MKPTASELILLLGIILLLCAGIIQLWRKYMIELDREERDEEKERCKHHHHKEEKLKPARHLKSQFISHIQGEGMERYTFKWTPGEGTSQELHYTANGGDLQIVPLADMTVSTVDVKFPTDANIDASIVTENSGHTDFVDSAHDVFVAKDETPAPETLKPATGLSHAWAEHIPDAPPAPGS